MRVLSPAMKGCEAVRASAFASSLLQLLVPKAYSFSLFSGDREEGSGLKAASLLPLWPWLLPKQL